MSGAYVPAGDFGFMVGASSGSDRVLDTYRKTPEAVAVSFLIVDGNVTGRPFDRADIAPFLAGFARGLARRGVR